MHYNFESSNSTASEVIARETKFGKLEAILELQITKIRDEFKRNEQLAISYDPSMLAHMSSLFEMSKPLIARDILEAKNLILELQIELRKNNTVVFNIDKKHFTRHLDKLAEELEGYQATLLENEYSQAPKIPH